ncbi:hypothetical protein ACHAXR_004618 [Thalassiosira sp. AJA248-18]
MKFCPSSNNNTRNRTNPPSHSSSWPTIIPHIPPNALQWSTAASAAAAISYADRGTSAIAASSLLEELHWTEGQLGDVQSAFFVGYALTQVLGGILGGAASSGSATTINEDGDALDSTNNKTGGYRTVLPLSLFFTGMTTLLFPLAATLGGSAWASVDRFCLGLLEGLLLPAAMAGVSATTTTISKIPSSDLAAINNQDDGTSVLDDAKEDINNNKATASSIVIAGCYMGSAWAYLSSWFLFSESFQVKIAEWGYDGSIWPWVFYINGILSMGCLLFFREEFNSFGSLGSKTHQSASLTSSEDSENGYTTRETNIANKELAISSTPTTVWQDTLSIAEATLSSKSGRAILAAQIGQGALLYSIASYGPLYLERVNAMPSNVNIDAASLTPSSASHISSVAVTASIAASSLILPQITQALVGISIGATADKLSSKFGTRVTRRALQLIGGIGPAVVLWYLSQVGSGENNADLLSPEVLFGAAQTLSALSLGAVSVSQLDIATPSTAGAVYALGNVAAAASGSFMVKIFGRLLEDGVTADEISLFGGGAEFALPFRIVAILSATGSLIYGCTVETELEIGLNGTANNDSVL